MKLIVVALILALAAPLPALARGPIDTTTCDGKRTWQREVVRDAVQRWFLNDPRPDALVELVQAEHGIAACNGGALPGRLHTTSLPQGLELDQLGAVLLANELEWRGLIAPPEHGLAGEYFRVLDPVQAADALRPAEYPR